MNEGSYCECVVARRQTVKDYAIKGLLVALAIAITVAGLYLSVLLVLAAVAWYAIITFWSRFQVVYEYVFVDGQIDFDKIMGGNSRKHVKRIDLDTVTIVAPKNSHALDGYKHLQGKAVDFTSLDPQNAGSVYVIVNKGDKDTELIRFEPDDNMITLMKKKAPRKVQEF